MRFAIIFIRLGCFFFSSSKKLIMLSLLSGDISENEKIKDNKTIKKEASRKLGGLDERE